MHNKIIIRLKKTRSRSNLQKWYIPTITVFVKQWKEKKGKMKGRAIPRVDGDLINGLDVCYFGRLEGWQRGGTGRSE